MAKSQHYRVYRVSESLRKAVKSKREASNVTTKAVLDAAVSEALSRTASGRYGRGCRPT
jgi:hypothetical protein